MLHIGVYGHDLLYEINPTMEAFVTYMKQTTRTIVHETQYCLYINESKSNG